MSIKVFGVTGTNGKTTVSWMLRNILDEKGENTGLIGTIKHSPGDADIEPVNTTPGNDLMKALLEQMKKQAVTACVMEISSHGISQNRIKDVRIEYGGFTNLTEDHLDYHKTMESYYETKKKLFFSIEKGAAINTDGYYGARLYEEISPQLKNKGITCLSVSKERKSADLYGKIIKSRLLYSEMLIYYKQRLRGYIKVPIGGDAAAENAMMATAMAFMDETGFDCIKRGIESLKSIPGRMEIVGTPDKILGVIDYAHTPDALEKLLAHFAGHKKGNLICVFGCGGDREKGKRRIMGKIAGAYSDFTVITGDNPRTEAPQEILDGIEQGVLESCGKYMVIPDRYTAIKRAVSMGTNWDIIVVAGKGHEKYQIIGDTKVPFDDKEVLTRFIG